MKSDRERRIHSRREYRTKVVFEDEFGDGLFYVYSEDLSMGGIFLASDIPAKVGSLLFLSFQLPEHKRPVRATAEVVRRTAGEGPKSSGMGVRFAGLSDVARKRLEEFLSE
ncbi:MAG: TIGR02266 family protein [Pseudomonadota bacterium]